MTPEDRLMSLLHAARDEPSLTLEEIASTEAAKDLIEHATPMKWRSYLKSNSVGGNIVFFSFFAAVLSWPVGMFVNFIRWVGSQPSGGNLSRPFPLDGGTVLVWMIASLVLAIITLAILTAEV